MQSSPRVLKMCTKCLVIQYTTEFNKHPKGKNGLQSWCRTCNRELCRQRREEIKNLVFDHYGARCSCCGETERAFLTLDHVFNDGAEHRRELGAARFVSSTDKVYRWLVKTDFAEGDRFQVLCYNCNCGRRLGVCPHKETK